MSSRTRGGPRGRSAAILTALVMGMTAGWPAGVRPALAHEFALALVTPTSGSAVPGPAGRDVVDGFRLAVDRSPDVSHPAGADAGDHLGGIDVEVSIIDGSQPREAAEAVRDQAAAGLTAAVVIAAEPTARAVTAELEASSVLLVLAEGAGASAVSAAGGLRLTQRSSPRDSAVAGEVAAAFERAHGRDLSPAAALGYDAGRLLDAAVARAGDGVEDLGSVVAAASELDGELVSSRVSAPKEPTAPRRRAASADAASGPGPGALVIGGVGAGLLGLVGAAGWLVRRRGARSG